ncbi:hypothetical protein FB45DRAFT_517895 [Roridomyces roridus]|uniref:Uncharacterized protein n=1 Tax=Roridomyces roridus TaxID=1738132 RepID=A0AAD7BXA9_9AGAR|nr:hypothetical protein FB45DRAFT_517895 [Roridomyces roridus]
MHSEGRQIKEGQQPLKFILLRASTLGKSARRRCCARDFESRVTMRMPRAPRRHGQEPMHALFRGSTFLTLSLTASFRGTILGISRAARPRSLARRRLQLLRRSLSRKADSEHGRPQESGGATMRQILEHLRESRRRRRWRSQHLVQGGSRQLPPNLPRPLRLLGGVFVPDGRKHRHSWRRKRSESGRPSLPESRRAVRVL